MISCDVCDSLIVTNICHICGFDNSYQFSSDSISSILKHECEILEYLEEERLLQIIVETYGVTIDKASKIVYGESATNNG